MANDFLYRFETIQPRCVYLPVSYVLAIKPNAVQLAVLLPTWNCKVVFISRSYNIRYVLYTLIQFIFS